MSVLKCKMCGGDIEISEDKTIGICGSCGTTVTFPKVSDEQKLDAFNRGNYFRRLGEFDKALQVYEHIISEEPQNAEAHWCCALCRFGIEYVEDPLTMEYIPTCHRTSFDIFTEDVDYLAALQYADGITKRQYQKDAVKITEVQRGILAASQNEKPFDVFICYKETDDMTGGRTVDSMLAQEIYYQLTDAGLRVFFSRITLEDKVGSEYEPYIFAALNSAKAMVCIGTKAENFNAVWVRNEWSRYLAIMRRDRSKVILPCYKDMNPYDMPEQLSVLQSYDMSKIGFMQDLIRGIKKITGSDEQKQEVRETPQANTASSNITSLLGRGSLALEDGDWAAADRFFEEVLNQDFQNSRAYLGKLMAELKVRKQEDLKNCPEPFDSYNNCVKACRFDAKLAEDLKADNDIIREKIRNAEKEKTYNYAKSLMASARTESDYKKASEMFASVAGFRDADEQRLISLEKSGEAAKEHIYNLCLSQMNNLSPKSSSDYLNLSRKFDEMLGYRNSSSMADICRKKSDEIAILEKEAAAFEEKVLSEITILKRKYDDSGFDEKLDDLKDRISKKEKIFNSMSKADKRLNTELENEIWELKDEFVDTFDESELFSRKIERLNELIKSVKNNLSKKSLENAENEYGRLTDVQKDAELLKEISASADDDLYVCPLCGSDAPLSGIMGNGMIICQNCGHSFGINEKFDNADTDEESEIGDSAQDLNEKSKIKKAVAIILAVTLIIGMVMVGVSLLD